MRLIRGIIGLALAILFAAFAVANRQSVELVWSPVNPPLDAPLYLIALGLLALGFLLGSLFVWVEFLPVRWQKSKQNRQIRKLEKELDSARQKPTLESQPATTPEQWTALPGKPLE